MYSTQLRDLCFRDKIIKQKFNGVYPENKFYESFKRIPEGGLACIVNTESKGGQHWYCVYSMDNRPGSPLEIFDSFGFRPRLYRGEKAFRGWFKGTGKKYLVKNTKPVQALSTNSCGLFTLYVLYFQCRGKRLPEIMKDFSSNKFLNEQKVRNFALRIFHINPTLVLKTRGENIGTTLGHLALLARSDYL